VRLLAVPVPNTEVRGYPKFRVPYIDVDYSRGWVGPDPVTGELVIHVGKTGGSPIGSVQLKTTLGTSAVESPSHSA